MSIKDLETLADELSTKHLYDGISCQSFLRVDSCGDCMNKYGGGSCSIIVANEASKRIREAIKDLDNKVTMPTNEERREVARRLRKNDPSSFATVFDVFREIGLAVNPQGHTFKVLPLQLADIIEPEPERTCENESSEPGIFTCSYCGADFYDTEISGDWNYCPNCGAKVIEE